MAQEQMRIPKAGDLVIAQITKIMPYGAYCKLLEYEGVDVFLPIKEVSSGWIKNIHEFIHEGQKIVCKVIFFDINHQTIDVSLKKVTPQETKTKTNTFNLEKRLGSLFSQAARASGMDAQKNELASLAISEFATYTNLVRNAADNTKEFEKSKLPKKVKESIKALIETGRKKKRYIVSYIMTLTTQDTRNGTTELRSILSEIKSKGVEVRYVSAPKYHLIAEGKDYADAEGKIRKATDVAEQKLKKGVFKVEKEKLKREKEDIMSTL